MVRVFEMPGRIVYVFRTLKRNARVYSDFLEMLHACTAIMIMKIISTRIYPSPHFTQSKLTLCVFILTYKREIMFMGCATAALLYSTYHFITCLVQINLSLKYHHDT